ncbi:hypothetical protein IFM89_007671 [Coptis chinensis]|uniref:Uncharacterized protein n=1 Tax=Coptis chinensis TaxID=261450 RepID=A0A835HPD3_9MAGN|nr:hypothetical protein IFM89_007671 [Coptis chinensis]
MTAGIPIRIVKKLRVCEDFHTVICDFKSVFKVWIDENLLTATKPGTGIVIAVKRLNQEGFQGHKEWRKLIIWDSSTILILSLVGYCLEDEQSPLVYEFMPRGSLENHLFRVVWMGVRRDDVSPIGDSHFVERKRLVCKPHYQWTAQAFSSVDADASIPGSGDSTDRDADGSDSLALRR